jgi:hypothetical protein
MFNTFEKIVQILVFALLTHMGGVKSHKIRTDYSVQLLLSLLKRFCPTRQSVQQIRFDATLTKRILTYTETGIFLYEKFNSTIGLP